MRALTAVALTLSAMFAQAQKATLTAMQDGKKVGTMTMDRKITGSQMTVKMVMDMKPPQGNAANIVATAVYDGKGMPKSKSANIISNQNNAKVMIAFIGNEARVTISSKGRVETKVFKPSNKSSLADLGAWWFVPGKALPKVKASYKFQSLSPLTLQWTESTTTYLGLETITVSGKKVKAHKVLSIRGANVKSTTWFDDNGIPYVMDQGNVRFVRQ